MAYWSNRRQHDCEMEQKVARFLDIEMYAHDSGIKFSRNSTDIELQKRGVDVIFEYADGTKKYIDEKSAITAWNYDLPTFVVELSAQSNVGGHGWFFNDGYSLTTHYMFVYPRSGDGELNCVFNCEAILVSKDRLRKYLVSNGVDETLASRFDSLSPNIDNKGREYAYVGEVKVMRSNQLSERPVNAIVKRSKLRELADKVYTYAA